jgi:DNA-binding NarL/FixJ family response regulator
MLLEAQGFEVVGEAQNGLEAVELARQHEPELVLMDLSMGDSDSSGLEAIRTLSKELPAVRAVVLTASEDESDLFEALQAGAQGFIRKNIGSEQFTELLRKAADGEPALTPDLARRILQVFSRRGAATAVDPDALTDRENDVLKLMVDGVTTNRSLAKRLEVSENTVKFHVRNILDKFHVHNRAEAVGHALRNKLVTPD